MTEEMAPLNRPEDEASRKEVEDSYHRTEEDSEPVEERAPDVRGIEEPLPEEELIGEPLPSIQMEEQLPEVQIEEPLPEVQVIEEPYLESPAEPEEEAGVEIESESRPSPEDLWPRSPFYLRFPWILAGPLAAAMILWFGSGAVLSATIAAPRPTSTPQALAAAKAQPTATPAQATVAPATQAPATPAPVVAIPTATPKPKPTPFPMAVYNTDGDGVYLNRTAGGGSGSRIKGWPDRTILQVIGEDQNMYGQTWRNVRDPQGNEGWVPAQYLVNPSRLPPATATPTPKPATPTPKAVTPTPNATAPASGTAAPGASGAATATPATTGTAITTAAATATRAAATATAPPPSSPTPRP